MDDLLEPSTLYQATDEQLPTEIRIKPLFKCDSYGVEGNVAQSESGYLMLDEDRQTVSYRRYNAKYGPPQPPLYIYNLDPIAVCTFDTLREQFVVLSSSGELFLIQITNDEEYINHDNHSYLILYTFNTIINTDSIQTKQLANISLHYHPLYEALIATNHLKATAVVIILSTELHSSNSPGNKESNDNAHSEIPLVVERAVDCDFSQLLSSINQVHIWCPDLITINQSPTHAEELGNNTTGYTFRKLNDDIAEDTHPQVLSIVARGNQSTAAMINLTWNELINNYEINYIPQEILSPKVLSPTVLSPKDNRSSPMLESTPQDIDAPIIPSIATVAAQLLDASRHESHLTVLSQSLTRTSMYAFTGDLLGVLTIWKYSRHQCRWKAIYSDSNISQRRRITAILYDASKQYLWIASDAGKIDLFTVNLVTYTNSIINNRTVANTSGINTFAPASLEKLFLPLQTLNLFPDGIAPTLLDVQYENSISFYNATNVFQSSSYGNDGDVATGATAAGENNIFNNHDLDLTDNRGDNQYQSSTIKADRDRKYRLRVYSYYNGECVECLLFKNVTNIFRVSLSPILPSPNILANMNPPPRIVSSDSEEVDLCAILASGRILAVCSTRHSNLLTKEIHFYDISGIPGSNYYTTNMNVNDNGQSSGSNRRSKIYLGHIQMPNDVSPIQTLLGGEESFLYYYNNPVDDGVEAMISADDSIDNALNNDSTSSGINTAANTPRKGELLLLVISGHRQGETLFHRIAIPIIENVAARMNANHNTNSDDIFIYDTIFENSVSVINDGDGNDHGSKDESDSDSSSTDDSDSDGISIDHGSQDGVDIDNTSKEVTVNNANTATVNNTVKIVTNPSITMDSSQPTSTYEDNSFLFDLDGSSLHRNTMSANSMNKQPVFQLLEGNFNTNNNDVSLSNLDFINNSVLSNNNNKSLVNIKLIKHHIIATCMNHNVTPVTDLFFNTGIHSIEPSTTAENTSNHVVNSCFVVVHMRRWLCSHHNIHSHLLQYYTSTDTFKKLIHCTKYKYKHFNKNRLEPTYSMTLPENIVHISMIHNTEPIDYGSVGSTNSKQGLLAALNDCNLYIIDGIHASIVGTFPLHPPPILSITMLPSLQPVHHDRYTACAVWDFMKQINTYDNNNLMSSPTTTRSNIDSARSTISNSNTTANTNTVKNTSVGTVKSSTKSKNSQVGRLSRNNSKVLKGIKRGTSSRKVSNADYEPDQESSVQSLMGFCIHSFIKWNSFFDDQGYKPVIELSLYQSFLKKQVMNINNIHDAIINMKQLSPQQSPLIVTYSSTRCQLVRIQLHQEKGPLVMRQRQFSIINNAGNTHNTNGDYMHTYLENNNNDTVPVNTGNLTNRIVYAQPLPIRPKIRNHRAIVILSTGYAIIVNS